MQGRERDSPELTPRERSRLQQAGQSMLETPRNAGNGGDLAEVSRLRAQVAGLENERDMRVKLEKLLEVQTVQVDLQKELRVKTESLLQVEQQTSSKLRQQVDELRRAPGAGVESHFQLEDRFREAQDHIRALEKQLAETTAPETSDRVESSLRHQIEEQERIITRLQEQMEGQARPAGQAGESDVVRLQLLLQSRDKHLDELTQGVRKAQNESAEAQSEADVLRHQVRVLKKEVSERTDEMERQLNCERNLRGEVFQLQGKLEQMQGQHQEEARRCGGFAERAAHSDDLQRRVEQLEQQLAEEQTTSRRERQQVLAEAEHRVTAKEQVIRNQTVTIEGLSRELKERQAEVDRLVHLSPEEQAASAAQDAERLQLQTERGGLLPPLQPPSPRAEGAQSQRSLESLHRQLKSKDVKIAKQHERLQALTEMLEKRDQQLEELSSARRDRDSMQQRVHEMEEVLKAQPRVVTHAEAERRLIEQEQRVQGNERQALELEEALRRERGEREALQHELSALRGHLADGASSSGALQEENVHLSRELAEVHRLLDARTEELRRVRETREAEPPVPDPSATTSLPAMQRRLQKLEDVDRNLARDLAVWVQERENKIDSLNSTIVLLRSSVDELRRSAEAAQGAAGAAPAPASPARSAADRGLAAGSAQASPRGLQAAGSQEQAMGVQAGPLPGQAVGTQASVQAGTAVGVQAALSPAASPRVAETQGATSTAPPTGMPLAVGNLLTTEDIRTMSAEEIRQELIARRQDAHRLEQQLEDKGQLVQKLVEEANLCSAEVASLQQSLNAAQKVNKTQEREYDELREEKRAFEKKANHLQHVITEKENKLTKLFTEHQEETSGNANVDEVDAKIGWKLRVLPPRQHEIRHSVFLVLNRRHTDTLDKAILSQGLAHHFAIAANRIEIVEDARLPDQAPEAEAQRPGTPGSSGVGDSKDFEEGEAEEGSMTLKRDLVLVNISDAEVFSTDVSETGAIGALSRSAVSATDVLDQVRNDMLRGHRIGPLDGISVDAIFINHGDMVLPFEWPTARAQLLLREGRVLAGKHAVITVHEVRDPYTLRIVAYDTEVGREFTLYLNTRDILLLLDTRDSEIAQVPPEASGMLQPAPHKHLQGPCATAFRRAFTVSEGNLLDTIISSLSFSVWQNQQILVASEMRIPAVLEFQHVPPAIAPPQTPGAATRSLQPADSVTSVSAQLVPSMQLLHEEVPLSALQPALLPEAGVTRGLRPTQRDTRRLFEDVIGFEGRICVFSLIHTTTHDLTEDVLRATLYYPKTSSTVEAILYEPMLSDRLRIVAEAGELDVDEPLSVGIVVEEVIYPPAFLVRLTSITLVDSYALSPQEASKPHTHVIRISKDGATAAHLPDISFAVSPSTIRTKLLRCIGLSTQVQCPREHRLTLPSASTVTAGASDEALVKRAVSGHVDESSGLRVQLKTAAAGGKPSEESEKGSLAMAAPMRAQLREKYGRGRLLKRQGRLLSVRGNTSGESIRVVVSVYERPQPYHHLVLSAYEPQTSREWEVLSDSIDVFRLFASGEAHRSQAIDLAIPSTRERIADVLLRSVELMDREGEIVLTVSPSTVRECTEAARHAALRDREREPEVAGQEGRGDNAAAPAESFDVHPAMTHLQTRAIGGFTGGFDREHEVVVEQTGRDRLFTAQRRLAPDGKGEGDLYTVHIYDSPNTAFLHSYTVLAVPLHDHPLTAAGLPRAIGALGGPQQPVLPPHYRTYTMKVDDKMLEDFLWGHQLLEPSRQEELLNYISQSLHLDEDKEGVLRLRLHKRKLRAHEIPDALEHVGQTGAKNPAAHADVPNGPGSFGSRELGGAYPLNKLRRDSQTSHGPLTGPSLQGGDDPVLKKMMVKDWKKIYCMAQRFGNATVIVTVSKKQASFKLGVYEPESSACYEMLMVTSSSSTPMNVLLERCELAGKVDLMLCMNEIAFPHQVQIVILHVPTSQEFNLKIGDDQVFTMVENSRREAFTHYFEQLITWGCMGFDCAPGTEAQALADVFEETFAGNQIFDRTKVEDALGYHLNASVENGELKQPNALAPMPPKKIRVPVVRTQLDALGKKAPPVHGISMHLLYHAEYPFQDEQCTLLMRLHKRAVNNDIALTLKVRNAESLALPLEPHRGAGKLESSAANGRSFKTPALGLGEVHGSQSTEITIWLQDKCSRSPCGAYGEICEVPGCPKQVLVFVTDEDAPRSVRVAVTLATLPFTVLFQVVLLESSETTAKVETSWALKPSASHLVMQQTFQKYFGSKSMQTPAIITHISGKAASERDRELRQRVDEMEAADKPPDHIGFEYGEGFGGPLADGRPVAADEPVKCHVVFMCTRRKLGRMMVFSVYRDLIATKMYLRVVMHDPVAKRDSHLTLLHFATMRLLNSLRISRDMLEECNEIEHDSVKYERQQQRAELGKLIIDHLFLQRIIDKEGNTEEIDHLEEPDDTDIEYELRMRDITDGSLPSEHVKLTQNVLQDAAGSLSPEEIAAMTMPRTLLDMKEDNLLHKGEKEVNGRRVLVAFFSETTKEDILNFSHNIRIVVACVQTLEVLVAKDFHEDTLEQICARRGKRHLMSATREQDLVRELWHCLSLEYRGLQVTGIVFTGMD